MTIDPNKAPPSGDRKLQMHADNNQYDDKHLLKARRLLQSASFLYPILLALLLIVGTALLVITITRRNTCRHLQEERIEASIGLLPKDHVCKTKSISIQYNTLTNLSRQLHGYLV
jgi:hypothetical protein